jgi:hypothetical protein
VVHDAETSNHSNTLNLKEGNMSANVIYTTDYRELWIHHNGPIPKDDQGRSFEIHHINGNRNDNRLENLKCVSIQEHYDIHLKQGDLGACTLIANKLNMSAEEISHLAIANNRRRAMNGSHPWLKDNVKKKECPWCHKSFAPTLYSLFHGDYCRSNPNALARKQCKPHRPHKPIQKRHCQWCHRWFNPNIYAQFHGDKCNMKARL